MNREALGALAEMVGAAGVIVTLGYLAVQIRRSNLLSTAESNRFAFMLGAFIGNSAKRFDEAALGILSEKEFDDAERGIIAPYLTAPGRRALWKRISARYPMRFFDYVERRIL